MVLIDSHGYSSQAGTHAVSLNVVIDALLLIQSDELHPISQTLHIDIYFYSVFMSLLML